MRTAWEITLFKSPTKNQLFYFSLILFSPSIEFTISPPDKTSFMKKSGGKWSEKCLMAITELCLLTAQPDLERHILCSVISIVMN